MLEIILLIGTSGSGKTTWCQSVDNDNYTILSLDDMRLEFAKNIDDKSLDDYIYNELNLRIGENIKNNKSVIVDTTNLKKERRQSIYDYIKKEALNVTIKYKLFELNPELARLRIKKDIQSGIIRANVSAETIDRHVVLYNKMLTDIKNEPITEYENKNIN